MGEIEMSINNNTHDFNSLNTSITKTKLKNGLHKDNS